jgi:3-isopropylmalate dehydrogenase
MKFNIAVLSGDGIGPEIVEQGMKAVRAVCRKKGHELQAKAALVGAIAIKETGSPYPDATHALCMASDAVFFGAIGSLEYDNNPAAKVRPEQGLLAMRKQLGLYANIRPVTTFPTLLHKSPLRADLVKGADLVCIRELTGGLYFGKPQGRSEDGTTAYDTCVYTREEIARIVHLAYGYARNRRRKLTVVDKANVLATSRLWRQTAQEISAEYPDVATEYMFVDNAAMRLIQSPADFDVLVTENMFGDILTDEASVITGSLGMLPSASIGVHTSVFEPIHGSFPQAAGKNIANPLATILSAALMFEYAFHLPEEAALIRNAVDASIAAAVVTPDIAPSSVTPASTTAVGDFVASHIEKAA